MTTPAEAPEELEHKSLPVHVTLCAERHRAVEGRLKALGRQVGRIEVWIVASLTAGLGSLAAKAFGWW